MSWSPNDLVVDADLKAYEAGILSQFGQINWESKRLKALEDWLGPILRTQGYPIERLRTRYEADLVYGYTGGTYADLSSAAKDTTVDDLDLAAVLATPASDALFLGSTQPFRGLSVRLHEAVSAVSALVSVAYWRDNWTPLTVLDGTQITTGKSFSGGGALTWKLPDAWVRRSLNGSPSYYWAKLTISAVPTSATAGQIGVIRRSSLCAPAALRTLALIFREAPTSQDGPWTEKAAYYETEADAALQRALQICAGEFETDAPPTDLISPAEAAQTSAQVARGFRLERG